MNAPFHKARYHDDAAPIPPADLRRAHRAAGLCWVGGLVALALMLAHHFGLGLDERPRVQWERL